MPSVVRFAAMGRTWEWPDGRTWARSLGLMDANYEPTHYRSKYGLW